MKRIGMTLGPPIRKPPQQRPEWTPVPDKPHLEQNAQGQLRTRIKPPDVDPIAWMMGHIKKP